MNLLIRGGKGTRPLTLTCSLIEGIQVWSGREVKRRTRLLPCW